MYQRNASHGGNVGTINQLYAQLLFRHCKEPRLLELSRNCDPHSRAEVHHSFHLRQGSWEKQKTTRDKSVRLLLTTTQSKFGNKAHPIQLPLGVIGGDKHATSCKYNADDNGDNLERHILRGRRICQARCTRANKRKRYTPWQHPDHCQRIRPEGNGSDATHVIQCIVRNQRRQSKKYHDFEAVRLECCICRAIKRIRNVSKSSFGVSVTYLGR